ncbi:MAG: M23 family metallopeptidase [Bacilli bacterium]|nr:M23 family metallopeptidase [Bacilli bacterium]
MKKRKLKPFVVPLMYVASIAMLIGSVYCIEKIVNNAVLQGSEVEEVEEVILDSSEEVIEEPVVDVPVVNTDPVIMRPYINGNVKIVKNYYDYQADATRQEESIVYYGNTYMQNSGVDYGMDGTEFEVVSILDGTVTEVVDDEIMGKTVKIKHSNDLISVYQSLGSVDVAVNTTVTQGTIIGKSGEANVSTELGNHLHFELYYQGSVVNPENYYDKLLGQLQ